MVSVGKTGAKHPIAAAQKTHPTATKQIEELRSARSAVEKLAKKNGSLMWFVMNIKGYTLNDGLANDITGAEGRQGGPTAEEKKLITDVRTTIIALDKALTLLDYKRHLFINAGVPEIQQAEYSWISERLTQFQKDKGLMSKDSYETRSLTGKNTIDRIIKTINEKIVNLQKNR
jgi:hypothetical protein